MLVNYISYSLVDTNNVTIDILFPHFAIKADGILNEEPCLHATIHRVVHKLSDL